MGITGSTRFQAISDRVVGQLKEHSLESFPPDARKTLRKFAMREAADFLKINQNTFRHYISTLSDRIPTGEMDKSNRRYFTLDEVHEIQRVLFEEGKTDPSIHPRRRGDEHCMVTTCFNLKGGSAKTSTCVSLGQALALRGFRVCLIDSDSQASLTNMFGITPEYDHELLTLYDMIRYENPVMAREVIQKTYFPNIDLIPASMNLMEFEYETALSFRTPGQSGAFHTRIAHALEPVLKDYDVILIDTPPQLSFAVIAALFASRGVLIPLNASMLDVMSLGSFLAMASNLMAVVEAHAPDHKFDFIKLIVTRYEASEVPQVRMSSFLRTIIPESMMTSEFVKSAAIGDAGTTKQTVFEVEPRDVNRKTYDRAIESINGFTDEFEALVFKAWGRKDGT